MSEVPLYLAHKKQPPPQDPTVALCLGTYGGHGGGVVSYERGTSVQDPCIEPGSVDQGRGRSARRGVSMRVYIWEDAWLPTVVWHLFGGSGN